MRSRHQIGCPCCWTCWNNCPQTLQIDIVEGVSAPEDPDGSERDAPTSCDEFEGECDNCDILNGYTRLVDFGSGTPTAITPGDPCGNDPDYCRWFDEEGTAGIQFCDSDGSIPNSIRIVVYIRHIGSPADRWFVWVQVQTFRDLTVYIPCNDIFVWRKEMGGLCDVIDETFTADDLISPLDEECTDPLEFFGGWGVPTAWCNLKTATLRLRTPP